MNRGQPGSSQTRWKPLRLPIGLILVGLLMMFATPLSGFGLFVATGGALALLSLTVIIWLAG